MAQQLINIGSSANKGDGDAIRTAFDKVNDNFTELYLDVVDLQIAAGAGGGATLTAEGIIGDVIGQDSTTIINSKTSTITANSITGDLKGSVVADDSTVLIDGIAGTISAGALTGSLPAIDGSALTGISATSLNGQAASYYLDFANFTNTPTTLAGYGITDSLQLGTSSTTALAGDTALFSGAFADLTSKPTTIAGYGITDATSTASPAFTGAVDFTGATSVDFTGATISGTSFLTSYTETDPVVGAITGIVKADGSGNISAAVAGTDYLTTVAFSDLTGKPTTVAGYGITDAFDGAFGSLSGTPTTLAGYGITDAATLNNMAPTGAVDFTGATSVDFTGATITALDSSGLTKPIDLDDNEEVRFGTDNDMTIYHSGTTGNIDNNTGTLIISGPTVRIQDGALANTAISAADGIATLYHTNTAVLNTTAGGIQIEKGVREKFATTNGATGVTALDCSTGHVHYLTAPAGDITANFTNLNLTAEYATNLTVIINQGATPYEVTAVQIGGAAQTIEWQGGSAPTGNANGIDSFSFTILNDGGTYVVLGQMVDFT